MGKLHHALIILRTEFEADNLKGTRAWILGAYKTEGEALDALEDKVNSLMAANNGRWDVNFVKGAFECSLTHYGVGSVQITSYRLTIQNVLV